MNVPYSETNKNLINESNVDVPPILIVKTSNNNNDEFPAFSADAISWRNIIYYETSCIFLDITSF